MLSRLFGPKTKEIKSPIHQVWVKYFTVDPPKQSHLQQLPPEFLSLFSQISAKYYTKQQINEERGTDDETFFVQLFKLDEPFNPNFSEFLNYLNSSSFCIGCGEKILPVIYPPIMQHLIQYVHKFKNAYLQAKEGNEEALSTLKELYPIIGFLFSLRVSLIRDSLFILKEVYDTLSMDLSEDSLVPEFCSEVLNRTLSFVTSIDENPEEMFPLFNFLVSYFSMWIRLYHTPAFVESHLTECMSICNGLTSIHPEFAIEYKEQLIIPILNYGFNALSFLFLDTQNELKSKDVVLLGIAFLKFLKYYTQLGTEFAMEIWEHQMIHFIPVFVMWTLDRFPIVEFEKEKEVVCDSDIKFYKSKQVSPPVFVFLEKNQMNTLHRYAKMTTIEDADQILQYSQQFISEKIISVGPVRSVFQAVLALSQNPTSAQFIATFFDIVMTYSTRLMNDRKAIFNTKCHSDLLTPSYLYFFIQFLLSAPIETVTPVLIQQKGFMVLTALYVFSQKYNTWSTDMLRNDNHFFYEIRYSIFCLFAKCYINQPESQFHILEALCNLFKTSPTVIDETLKFIMVIFRTSPVAFIENVASTNLITVSAQYNADLQKIYLDMLEQKYDVQKIAICEQSRTRTFHLFDLLACIDRSRVLLFSNLHFCKTFVHFFFEPNTVDFALDVWKDGLLIDNGLIQGSMNPINNIFTLQKELIDESRKHVDDNNWIKLIIRYLDLFTKVLPLNRKSLLDWIEKFRLLYDISTIPNISTDNETIIEIANLVLRIFYLAVLNSPKMRKIITHEPMMSITSIISGRKFGEPTVKCLLDLIFESSLDLKNLPRNIDIHDSKMIPFIHDATKHLEYNEFIFKYLCTVCTPSVTNKLKVFQSSTPIVILKYIQSFPAFPAPSKTGEYKPTVNSMLILFATVSSVVFKWKTFYEAIKSMRPSPDHKRHWWTVQLISTFSTILSEISSRPPSSFFHFDGRHTGIDLPVIPAGVLADGFTFIIRFELSTNWSLENQRACLLSLKDDNNNCIQLFFENKKLVFQIVRGKDKPIRFVISTKGRDGTHPYCFKPNFWYRLIFAINENNRAFVYVGKSCLIEFGVKGYKLEGTIKNGKIACANPTVMRVTEDPLIANISSMYLFDHCLDPQTLQRMVVMPDDYCFGFSPSQASAFPDVPKELFTQEINASMLFCYNARMTAGSTCANCAERGIGNAEVRGLIIPFSTSFIDVVTNMGGLKLFLPLIQHANYPIANEVTNDSSSFLLSILCLFTQFFNNSDTIQRDFFQSQGTKSLAYLLSKINKETINSRILNQLCDIFCALREKEHRLIFIHDIFLNFSLWRCHKPETVINLLEYTWERIYSQDISLLIESISASNILFLLNNEPDRNVRQGLWSFLQKYVTEEFPVNDQESLFEFAFSNVSTELLLEILDNMYFMMKSKLHNFHKIIEKYDYYVPFVHLSMSTVEAVRIFSIRYICLIYDLQISKDLQNENAYQQFVTAVLNSTAMFNPNESTDRMWNYATNLFFDNPQYQSVLLVFVIHISAFYEKEAAREFLTRFNKEIKVGSYLSLATSQCPGWMIWIFHAMMQANRPTVQFGTDETVTDIYANVLTTLILNRQPILDEVSAFFSQQLIIKNNDITDMQRKIFSKVLDLISNFEISSDIMQLVVTPIFRFIFFPNQSEIFSVNVQLHSSFSSEVKSILNKEIKSHTPFTEVTSVYTDMKPRECRTVFSMRITKDGLWLDYDLAKRLMLFLVNYQSFKELYELKIKPSAVVAYIAGSLIQCKPEETVDIFRMIQPVISSDTSSIAIFAQACYRNARTRQDSFEFFAEFLRQYPDMFLKGGKDVDLNKLLKSKQFVKDFNETIKESYSSFTLILAERENEKAIKSLNESIKNYHIKVNEQLIPLKPQPQVILPHSTFNKKLNIFNHEYQLLYFSTGKAWRRLWRELSTNGGPWCINGNAQHWKLSMHWDSHFRRIFMKPNIDFDTHIKASIRRDASSETQAQEEYKNWLQTHPETVIDDANEEEEIKEGEVPQQKNYSFSAQAKLITLQKNFDGTFFMNDKEISFDDVETKKNVQFELSELEMVLLRSYLHIDSGLEFFLSTRHSFFLIFNKTSDRQRVLRLLRGAVPSNVFVQTSHSAGTALLQEATNQWILGNLTNFDYLMKVNFFAGRSYNDLSQYPVFPWVLCKYDGETIDLNDPSVYRDLSKPIGALNKKRLESCIMNYNECPESPVKCLYRMHYSNAFYVLNFLLRLEPFTKLHIEVNDDKFDKANRMFSGIKRSWEAVTSNLADYRELIPEFYCCTEFLTNHNNFDLGSDGTVVNGDVILPEWAHSPSEFIAIHREALESKYVSEHLGQWIDLIFGYKQQGEEAVKAYNTFHKYCYASSIVDEPEMLQTIQFTAGNVGIIPRQLFTSPHPTRLVPAPLIIRKSRVVSTSTVPVLYISSFLKGVLALTKDADLNYIPPSGPPLIAGSISSVSFMHNCSQKNYAYLPEISRFVVSSPWDSCFHIFKLETQLIHDRTERQKYSLIQSIDAAGNSRLLTVWRDSSISLYNAETGAIIYRITPHLVSLIDTDLSESLDVLVSIDKDNNVVISRLSTGAFIRSFTCSGIPQKIKILDQGYIAIASGSNITTVMLYTINTDRITSKTFDGHLIAWESAGKDYEQKLVLSLDSKQLIVLSLPMLEVFSREALDSNINLLSYEHSLKGIMATNDDNQILIISVV